MVVVEPSPSESSSNPEEDSILVDFSDTSSNQPPISPPIVDEQLQLQQQQQAQQQQQYMYIQQLLQEIERLRAELDRLKMSV